MAEILFNSSTVPTVGHVVWLATTSHLAHKGNARAYRLTRQVRAARIKIGKVGRDGDQLTVHSVSLGASLTEERNSW